MLYSLWQTEHRAGTRVHAPAIQTNPSFPPLMNLMIND
jgi:hypothetical protein